MKYLILLLSLMLGGCMATVDPITPRTHAVYVATSGAYSAPPVRLATSIVYRSSRSYRRHAPYWGNTPSQRRQRRWPSYVCSNWDPDCARVHTRSTRRGPYITYRNKPVVIIKRNKPKVHGIVKNKPPQGKANPNARKNHKKRKHKSKRKRNKKR